MTTWSASVVEFLRARIDARAGGGRRGGAADPRPGAGLRQDARADGRGAAAAGRCCARSGGPLLLAASRKDFVGAITGRPPAERDPGTLAALGYGVDAGASILRVHDVAGAADYFAVRSVLRGERVLGALEGLTPERYPDGVPPHLALG